MSTVLMTGFPGFLGSALLPRLLARRPGSTSGVPGAGASPRHGARPARRHRERPRRHRAAAPNSSRATSPWPGLGLRRGRTPRGRRRGVAPRRGLRPRRPPRSPAGSTSTAPRTCWTFCQVRPGLRRLQYVSTCYVSGRYDGRVRRGRPRRGSGVPQPLRVDEVRGRAAGPQGDGRRPAGDRSTARASSSATRSPARRRSTTAPTSSRTFLRRQPPAARGARRRRRRRVRISLVPRDFVIAAMDELSVARRHGRAHLRPHRPEPADRARESSTLSPATSASGSCGVPAAAGAHAHRRSASCPAWSGCSACPPRHSTTSPRPPPTRPKNTVADSRRDRASSARRSPSYAGRLLDYMVAHPEHRLRGDGLTARPLKPRTRTECTMADNTATRRQRQPDRVPSATTTSTVDVPGTTTSASCASAPTATSPRPRSSCVEWAGTSRPPSP